MQLLGLPEGNLLGILAARPTGKMVEGAKFVEPLSQLGRARRLADLEHRENLGGDVLLGSGIQYVLMHEKGPSEDELWHLCNRVWPAVTVIVENIHLTCGRVKIHSDATEAFPLSLPEDTHSKANKRFGAHGRRPPTGAHILEVPLQSAPTACPPFIGISSLGYGKLPRQPSFFNRERQRQYALGARWRGI